MTIERRKIDLGNGAVVSAEVAFPETATRGSGVAVVLAHGAGNDMHSAFVSHIHSGLAGRGHATVKFNFPYIERGRRAPDPARVLEDCYRRVVAVVRDDDAIDTARLVIGGKSMGGRMASHLAAQGEAVDGLVFLGYPLHPAGRPDKMRDAHLLDIRVPMLFFAGTRDALCRLDLLRATLKGVKAPVQLHVIEGADHSFNVLKSLQRDPDSVRDEIVDVSDRWLRELGGD